MNNLSADEMFEQAGWTKSIDKNYGITYSKKVVQHRYIKEVCFLFSDKKVYISDNDCEPFGVELSTLKIITKKNGRIRMA